MATDKEVEKRQKEVAALRDKLTEERAGTTTDATSDNDITLKQLDREAEELQAQIDEAQATRKLLHPDAQDPIAYAQSLLRRDEEAVVETDTQVAESVTKTPDKPAERKGS
jgi:hypothetical protein